MKIAIKVVLAMVLALVAIRVFEGVLTVRRETKRLNAAIDREGHLLGRILSASVRNAWQAEGREYALTMIDQMNMGSHPVQITWFPTRGEEGLEARLDTGSLNRLRLGETIALRQRDDDKGDVQFFYVPTGVPEADGAIRLTENLADRSRYIRTALLREALSGGIVVFVSTTVVIVLGVVVIGRPLSRLRERINRIGEGDLSNRLALKGRDELSALADGLNEMCQRLSLSRQRERAETEKRIAAMEQVRHMDRLTTIGRLASGIAHELGTPLNVISGRAGMVCDGSVPPESTAIRKNAEAIKSQADRMTQTIRHLLDFARQRPPKRAEANAVHVARHAADLVGCIGYEGNVRVEAVGDAPSHMARMDAVQMQQVLTNLIENALQATPEKADAVVRIKSTRAQPPEEVGGGVGQFIEIAVEDSGTGIPKECLPNVFDPFFTTKDVGKGTGLGLSIAYGIVREHEGWIDIQSTVGEGSRFAVYLPQEASA